MKSCPFCFSTDVGPWRKLGSNRFYHDKCSTCGALGSMFEEFDSSKKGMEGSVRLWNKRSMIFNQD